ncbi:hypothetical protein KS4_29000 [Poriferisphaera corsica]|uniref:Uncharacterized protein n=1 Tax=Poriferisphaera corsica TaxID=2528020 RepID=A0A517YX68_9BACT|nr:hypothetical protein [Poriferisphaera corsica]QDU34824.1 hypothetical protein KS4_29000 [Poriferisphaera corsica]
MQLQEALNLIHQKFVNESQGKEEESVSAKYFEAFEKFPAVMETASQIFAAQIIAQNIQQQQAAGQGEAPSPIQTP